MRIIISILFLLIPVISVAQDHQVMNQADIQDMMQKMQEMQECMAKIDQAELALIEQQSEEIEAELKSLCELGKRKKAQKKAIDFSKEMMRNPALKQMEKCGEIKNLPSPAHTQEIELVQRGRFSSR